MKTSTSAVLSLTIAAALAGCNANTAAKNEPTAPAAAQAHTAASYDKPGYVTEVHDGRLWVFHAGSTAYEDFKTKGEPAKVVTRIGAGPNGMTLRSTDASVIDGYLAAGN